MKQRATRAQPHAGGPTADELVRAARVLFARLGYEGASVRAITAEAGANLGAITYHFGSKRELYDRVVESLVVPLADRIEQEASGGGAVLDRAAAVVDAFFEYLADNPDLPPLMMQELTLAAVPPDVVAAPMRRVLRVLAGLIREGQVGGEVRRGPAEALGVFILSVPVHMGMMGPALREHGRLDLQDTRTRKRVAAAAAAFVRGGLSA
jgi:AcrR family transcriptional regulator